MNIKTLSRLFVTAASRIQGDEGYKACYHFGMALAISNIPSSQEDDYNGYDREGDIRRHIKMGKVYFRNAKRDNRISYR